MGSVIADVIFVLIGAAIVLISAKHGFFRTLTRFARVFLAIILTYFFGNLLAPWIATTIPIFSNSVIAMVVSYVFVFLISIVLITVFTWFVGALIERVVLINKINTILGAVIGLISACVVLFIIASIMKFLPISKELYAESVVIRFFGDKFFFQYIPFLNLGKTWFETVLH